MTTVGIPDLPVIYPLLQGVITEKGVNTRITPDRAMDKVHTTIKAGGFTVLVDELFSPKILLLLHVGESFVFDEKTCTVILIYIPREERTPDKVTKALAAINEHAVSNGCKTISASSWLYNESSGIGAFWKRDGYTEQETVYVKHLT